VAHDRNRDPGDAVLSLFCQERLDKRASRRARDDKTLWPHHTSFGTRRGGRLFDLARMLGMSDFLNDILAQWRPQRAKTQSEAEREAGEEFAIDLIILRHEADALGIRPTTSEIASVVSKMRASVAMPAVSIRKSITTSWKTHWGRVDLARHRLRNWPQIRFVSSE
jgi:hypothetical protein